MTKIVVKPKSAAKLVPNSASGRGGSTWEAEKQSTAEVATKRAAARKKNAADRRRRESAYWQSKQSSATRLSPESQRQKGREAFERDVKKNAPFWSKPLISLFGTGLDDYRSNDPLKADASYFKEQKRKRGVRSNGLSKTGRIATSPVDFLFSPIFSDGNLSPTDPEFYLHAVGEAALLSPFGRPIAGARAAARGGAKLASSQSLKAASKAATEEYGKKALTRRASSKGAGLAARALEKVNAPDPLVNLVRNDKRATRVFKHGESEVWADAAHSRTGKLAEKAYDVARPVLSSPARLPGWNKPILRARTEQEKWAQVLAQHHHEARKQGQTALMLLNASLPKGMVQRFRNLKAPEYYALRMVGKGVDPDTMVGRFAKAAEAARKEGEVAQAAMLEYHAAQSLAAKNLVEVVGGKIHLSPAAGKDLQNVLQAVENAGKARERIYSSLDILNDSRAKARLTNEELWFYGATHQGTEKYVQQTLARSTNRKALWEIAKERSPENAQSTMFMIDALARNWMRRAYEENEKLMENLRGKVAAGSRDPQVARDLRELEITRKRGIDPDIFYREWKQTLDQYPQEMIDNLIAKYGDQIAFKIDPFHTFTEAKMAGNLRLKLNPKNKGKGHPENKAVFRNVNGQKVVVLGKVTPQQWVKRVLAVMPDQGERTRWAEWYDEFEDTFRSLFGDDADALMRGFAVSQANASPASGLRAVFKIMEALQKGEVVETGYGSVVASSIAKAVQNGEIDKGIAAKLSDFIDSLMKSDTRTWMGNAPEGGRPTAVDVHAARDRGLVDRKMVVRLKENFGMEEGSHYTVDNLSGSPSGIKYERVAEWYGELTDHLNAISFDGRTNWEPRQVQALGWASNQMLHGVDPQDFSAALERNTRKVSFEVTKGMEGLGNDLTNEQATIVAKSLEPDMHRLVRAAGGYLNKIEYSVSRWEGELNASVHLNVTGTDEAIDKALTLVAQAFDQHLVQGTRTITHAGAKASLVISSDAFADDAVRLQFGERLREVVPELANHGDMPDVYEGLPAFTVVTARNYVRPKTLQRFLDRYKAGIEQVEDEMGISVRYSGKNTDIRIGDQVGRADYDATSGRPRQLDDLDPAAREVRGRLEEAIRSVRETHPASSEEVAAGAARRDRAAYDSLLEESARAKGAKKVTEKQLADAEEESLRLANRYPDDPWAQEFFRLRSSLELDDTPEQHIPFSLGDEPPVFPRPGDAPLRDAPTAAGSMAARGAELAARYEGVAEAAQALEGGTLPVEWLKRVVADKSLAQYDKYAIGGWLDAVVRKGGGQSLMGGRFPSVPGLESFIPKNLTLRGVYVSGDEKTLVLGSKAQMSTFFHELMHTMHFEDLLPGKLLDDIEGFIGVQGEYTAQQIEDVAHLMEATIYGFDSELSKLPDGLKAQMEKVRDAFKAEGADITVNAVKMLEKMPRELQDAVENLFFFEKFGDDVHRFHGASDGFRDRATIYMPETAALPVDFKNGLAKVSGMVRARLSNGRSNLTVRDDALHNEFRAHLLETGAFDKDVLKGTIAAQMKAANVWAMSRVRQEALKIADDSPMYADDIAVPVSAEGFGEAAGPLRLVHEMLQSIDEGKRVSEAELTNLDQAEIEAAMGVIFPGTTKYSEKTTAILAQDILDGVRQPIEGVKWVRRNDLLNIGDVFKTPGKSSNLWKPVDWLNEYARFAVLIAKPSYIPMNLSGNAVMVLLQQGPFAAPNVFRAFTLHNQIGDHAALIDFAVGTGQTKALFGASESHIPGLGTHVFSPLADATNLVVDRIPRRMAFIYEARKLGYKTPDELVALLTEPKFVDDLTRVSKRARNAMVDFENLSDFERKVMSRIVFVYPWLKGSTFWAGRWGKDHPVQAMAAAALLYYQQDRLNDAMPDGYPEYLKWWLPIGSVERGGKTLPYGPRLDQFLTFLQPLDVTSDLLGAASGGDFSLMQQNVSALINYAQPNIQEITNTLYGFDPFRHQEIDTGVPDLLRRLFSPERFVVVQQIQKIKDSKETGLYKRNQKDAWLNLMLGSIGPTPVDPEEAAEQGAGGNRASAGDRMRIWTSRAEKTLGTKMPPKVIAWKENEQKYNSAVSKYERKVGGDSLTDQERAVVLFSVYAENAGQKPTASQEQRILGLSDDDVEKLKTTLREKLGLTQIGRLGRALTEREKEQRTDG